MIIIPAIDLMGGECVRLVRGERENKITYGKSPVYVAQGYMGMGARIIHVVDLDGAFTGEMKNIGIIRELAREFPIQVGGGIRSEGKVAEVLGLGVKKVIVSTLLMKGPELAEKLKKEYRGRLVGSFDFKDGKLSYAGWTQKSELSFEEVSAGLDEIVVTDTSRDGTYLGPNLELLRELKGRCNARIVSAGGVRNAQDLVELSKIGIYGAIAGRAFLEDKVELGGMGLEIGGD